MALTGLFVNGVCNASPADAVAQFASMFPCFEGGYMLSLSSVLYSAPNLFAAVVNVRSLATGAVVARPMPFQAVACDPALFPSSVPFDYVLASAFWVFAFSFTVGAWFLAKNLGLILEGIKRW